MLLKKDQPPRLLKTSIRYQNINNMKENNCKLSNIQLSFKYLETLTGFL